MAATSTNKQPLLIDHVLHYVKNLDQAVNDGMDVTGTNTAVLLIDSTTQDGAMVEDIYVIARGTTPYKVNLYMSSARDYMRPNEAVFVGSITSATTKGDFRRWGEMPRMVAPAVRVGNTTGLEDAQPLYNRGFYLPKGYSLWAAREGNANVSDGPLVGCQGGWY